MVQLDQIFVHSSFPSIQYQYQYCTRRIKVVTYYLQKLAASLFNSLHECSERETTDQQYAANVMRMENSYFFTQTIKQRGPELMDLFSKQITAASSICKQSTDAYLGFMIKREFKSLHTLFASIFWLVGSCPSHGKLLSRYCTNGLEDGKS